MDKTSIRRWLPLIILIVLMILFFSFHLNKYFSFEMLQENRALLISWTVGELILPWVMAIRERKTLRTFTDAIIPYPNIKRNK